MALITWQDNYSVEIDEIDQQHKKLISLINQFYDAMRSGTTRSALGPVLAELLEYTHYHFAAEENLLAEYEYPDLAAHKELHAGLSEKTKQLRENFEHEHDTKNIDVMLFLSNWLNVHILEVDKKYALYLKQHKNC
jgi:hemerythrin